MDSLVENDDFVEVPSSSAGQLPRTTGSPEVRGVFPITSVISMAETANGNHIVLYDYLSVASNQATLFLENTTGGNITFVPIDFNNSYVGKFGIDTLAFFRFGRAYQMDLHLIGTSGKEITFASIDFQACLLLPSTGKTTAPIAVTKTTAGLNAFVDFTVPAVSHPGGSKVIMTTTLYFGVGGSEELLRQRLLKDLDPSEYHSWVVAVSPRIHGKLVGNPYTSSDTIEICYCARPTLWADRSWLYLDRDLLP